MIVYFINANVNRPKLTRNPMTKKSEQLKLYNARKKFYVDLKAAINEVTQKLFEGCQTTKVRVGINMENQTCIAATVETLTRYDGIMTIRYEQNQRTKKDTFIYRHTVTVRIAEKKHFDLPRSITLNLEAFRK